jgi:hypothetical protein
MRITRTTVALAAALLTGLAWLAPAAAGVDRAAAPHARAFSGADVDALVRSAARASDLATADAVVLFESTTVDLSTPGERRVAFHRVVWIATEIAIGAYADVRVPHPVGEGTIAVHRLRTWRDGRWWPHETAVSPTAVVETLPFAVQSADDYTDRRETMLLHDGVELPCVLEVEYETVEKLAPAAGDDGLFVFAGEDPALAREFVLLVSPGTPVAHAEGNGAQAPEQAGGLRWRMAPAARLPRPPVADPSAAAPYVVWSTWPDWDALAAHAGAWFAEPGPLPQDLLDSLAVALRDAPTPRAKAMTVADLVSEGTRLVDCDPSYWTAPRAAARTWDTAYGHRLDRAVLAAPLFEEAGLRAAPCFLGRGFGAVDGSVPGLSRFGGVSLLVRGDGFEGIYDPSTGRVADGAAPLAGRAVWVAARGTAPATPDQGGGAIRIVLTLAPGENGAWAGTGFCDAQGALSPHHEAAGLSNETGAYLGGVAGALAGAELTDHSVERLDGGTVTAGFALSLAAPEPDDRGRTTLVLGEPSGGVMDALPADARLFEERRASPVLLPGPLRQEVELRLSPGEREVVLLPTERTIENRVGAFALSVERDGDRVTVRRTLRLGSGRVEAADWPLLRTLLLAETDERSTTIVLK